MGKKKKAAPADPRPQPLGRLAILMQKAGIEVRPVDKKAPSAPPAQPAVPPPPTPAPLDDDALFEDAMNGVHRINWRRDPAPFSALPYTWPEDDGLGDDRLFQEAVTSEEAPPLPEHPEYIEGWVGLAGRRFLPGLRNGVYSIQGALDLHGLSRVEAREAVEAFITRMSRVRSCCIKIVHGRGINSPNDRAVLKEHLQRWLATRRMSRHVVAYASAPHSDGGVGAVYVLLRRVPR